MQDLVIAGLAAGLAWLWLRNRQAKPPADGAYVPDGEGGWEAIESDKISAKELDARTEKQVGLVGADPQSIAGDWEAETGWETL